MNTIHQKSFLGVKNAGFTLIELLVVVLIIGILAAVALPQYQVAVAKARFIELMTLGRSFQLAEERYYLANGAYASEFSSLDLDLPGGMDGNTTDITYPNGNSFRLRPSGFIYAINPQGLKAEYTGWFDRSSHPGLRQCLAYAGDTTAEKMCRSLGGIESGIGTCDQSTGGGSCKKFDLP